ncbi:MAG: helix-turn-helix domain-containing protein [Nitrospirota bacterium]|nr:helix-turn-helix domain-containing protein [Nitrospirota bacterium]
MSDGILVDANELARRLGQAKSSIYRLHKKGLIPSYGAGPNLRGLRFDVEEVKAVVRRPARQAVENEPNNKT